MFTAIQIQNENSAPVFNKTLVESDLPNGDVLIKTDYTTVNYKDSLAIVKKIPVIRNFPMIPGIDLSGTVISSKTNKVNKGQKVLVCGWGLGESRWGGFSELVRVQNEWITSVPQNFSTKDVMIIGTAGFTAMLAVKKMLNHGTEPRSGKVLVTGASGGLGSLAVMILKKLKFEVVAATTKPNNIDYLKFIGAKEVILVQELEEPKKLLDKQKWAAVIDTLGSRTLAIACAATKIDGAVISCGNVQGMDLHTSVAPFILRGISLYGVNSVYRSTSNRKQIWNLLSDTLSCSELLQISSEFSFDKTILIAENVFKGETFGRSIIKLN